MVFRQTLAVTLGPRGTTRKPVKTKQYSFQERALQEGGTKLCGYGTQGAQVTLFLNLV